MTNTNSPITILEKPEGQSWSLKEKYALGLIGCRPERNRRKPNRLVLWLGGKRNELEQALDHSNFIMREVTCPDPWG